LPYEFGTLNRTFTPAVVKQAVHIKHATVYNGADVHRNLPKNYLKLGNNYGIGLTVRYRVRVSV